ncbi:hypothetical protein BDV93DRAFT_212561 [Ceratobasidium sp. AG-I]|nr:hypothetical protein BDV93DRAFT_212561 [Ceratobasidium sp. AG-I]
MGSVVPLPELPLDSDAEAAASSRHASSRAALRNKVVNVETASAKRRSPETDGGDGEEDERSAKRTKTQRHLDKAERDAKRQRRKEKEARKQARAERKEEKRKLREEKRERRLQARAQVLAGITNLISALPESTGSPGVSFPSPQKENLEPEQPVGFPPEVGRLDILPDLSPVELLVPEPVRFALQEEAQEEEEDEGESSDEAPDPLEDLKVVLVPPRHRSFLGQAQKPNPHSFGRIPRFVYEDDPLLDMRITPHQGVTELSDVPDDLDAGSDSDEGDPHLGKITAMSTHLDSPVSISFGHTPPDSDAESASDLSEPEVFDSEWDDECDPLHPDARSVASSRCSVPVTSSLPSPPRSSTPDSDPDDCVDFAIPLRTMGMWRKWTPLAGANRRGAASKFNQSAEMHAETYGSESEEDSQWGSTLSDLSEDDESTSAAPIRHRTPTCTYTSFNRSLLTNARARMVSRPCLPVVEYTGIDDEGKEITSGEPTPRLSSLPASALAPSADSISSKDPPCAHLYAITLRAPDQYMDHPVPHEDEWAIPLPPINMSFFTSTIPDPPSPVLAPERPTQLRASSAISYRPVTPVSMTEPHSKSPTPFPPDARGASLLSRALRVEQQSKHSRSLTVTPDSASLSGKAKAVHETGLIATPVSLGT